MWSLAWGSLSPEINLSEMMTLLHSVRAGSLLRRFYTPGDSRSRYLVLVRALLKSSRLFSSFAVRLSRWLSSLLTSKKFNIRFGILFTTRGVSRSSLAHTLSTESLVGSNLSNVRVKRTSSACVLSFVMLFLFLTGSWSFLVFRMMGSAAYISSLVSSKSKLSPSLSTLLEFTFISTILSVSSEIYSFFAVSLNFTSTT